MRIPIRGKTDVSSSKNVHAFYATSRFRKNKYLPCLISIYRVSRDLFRPENN